MKVGISSGAETDVGDGYWFYERQSLAVAEFGRSQPKHSREENYIDSHALCSETGNLHRWATLWSCR